MFRRSNTIVLVAIRIVLIIIILRLLMLILMLTIRRGLTFMVCLMVHRSNTLLFAAMGNESPIVEGLENYPEPRKQKGKGGKTKEVNNARGIPEAIRLKMGYDTPPEE